MPIYIFFEMVWVLLSLFYNKMASRSLNFAYMSIEFFVNLLDVGYKISLNIFFLDFFESY
jgi:hypothetical protein